MNETLFSNETLGIVSAEEKKKREEKTSGWRIGNGKLRVCNMYELLLGPYEERWPLHFYSVTFRTPSRKDAEPDYFFKWIPVSFSLSVWRNRHNGLYTVRVPKQCKGLFKEFLEKQNYYFDTRFYWWNTRTRQSRPNAVRLVEGLCATG